MAWAYIEGVNNVSNPPFAKSATPVVSDPAPSNTPRQTFDRMDAEFVRVLEDLVVVLIDKGIIALTDLPPHAQAKLLDRRGFRDHFTQRATVSGDDFIDALDDSRFGLMR